MELVYSVSEKRGSDEANSSSLYGDGGICTVSSKSVVAFTRTTTRQDNYRHRIPIYTVCVMDLNCPYEPHVIVESASHVSSLVFSSDGSQLLVVRSMGAVQLFSKGAGLHDWSVTHTCDWGGEDILHINFFHGGIRTSLHASDVKVHALYTEKFTAQPHKPSLADHGQCAVNGFFAVTASGLLLVCSMTHEGNVLAEQKVVLGHTRDNFTVATAALAPSGYIHIATWKPEMIKCWCIEMKLVEEDGDGGRGVLRVKVQAAQSFCPFRSGTAWHSTQKNEGFVQVTSLKYTEIEDPNSLLVALSVSQVGESVQPQQTPTGTTASNVVHMVQRYQLQEQVRPLLKLFKPMAESTGVTTKEWVCVGEWVSSSSIVTLGTAPRNLLPGPPGTQLPFIITAATVDSCIYAINRDTMQQMSLHSLQGTRGSSDEPPAKRMTPDKHMICLAHTWSGFSLLAMDSNGSLHFFTLMRPADVGFARVQPSGEKRQLRSCVPAMLTIASIGPQWTISVILLLEFALVSGNDWWDLLVSTPPSSIHTLTDRLTETFFQHSTPIIQHLHTRFLVMKTSMLRLAGNQQQKAIEARLQAQLTAIQQLFRSLRPVTCDVATAEKNISTSLQAFQESRSSMETFDIEKALDHFCSSVNIKDCQVDPGLLQNLQPLLQFSADLALFILFMLAQNSKFELARDVKIIQCLREILFVARLWHRQNKLVLPQMFHKTQSVDVWAQIYKLLTRLAQILPGEPDSSLIDECVLLETQVVCRELPLHFPVRGVTADMSSSTSTPLMYEFGQSEGSHPSSNGNHVRVLEGALPPLQLLDPLHYHYLAVQEPKFSCTRCCSVRGSWWGEGETVWEQQWASNCICSGHWAHCPITPPKAA